MIEDCETVSLKKTDKSLSNKNDNIIVPDISDISIDNSTTNDEKKTPSIIDKILEPEIWTSGCLQKKRGLNEVMVILAILYSYRGLINGLLANAR